MFLRKWSEEVGHFEDGYPEEMPKKLLQTHMYAQMLDIIKKYKPEASDSSASSTKSKERAKR